MLAHLLLPQVAPTYQYPAGLFLKRITDGSNRSVDSIPEVMILETGREFCLLGANQALYLGTDESEGGGLC